MPEIVTTPMSFFEALIEFERPNFNLLSLERVVVVQSLFEAFSKWNIRVDDMEIITTGKPSEQGIKFKIPAELATFFLLHPAVRASSSITYNQ